MNWEDYAVIIGVLALAIIGGFVVQNIIYKIRDWWKG